jgi:homoserine dehydrogenase
MDQRPRFPYVDERVYHDRMSSERALRVVFLGAGNVVRGLLEYWIARDIPISLEVVGILRQAGVWRGTLSGHFDPDDLDYSSGPDPLDGADLVIEALPSVYPHGEPATALLTEALDRGIDVLTVNKGPLVAAYTDLNRKAHASGALFHYCIDGVFPAVNTAIRDLRGATLTRMRAAVNSTANMILSEMELGKSFDESLVRAIALGITEPDSNQDIEGIDTAAKMVIMVNATTGANFHLDDVRVQSIRNVDSKVAISSGRTWKQVGTYDGESIWVGPRLYGKDDSFYGIRGTEKIVEFVTDEMGTITIMGGASGRQEMSAAIVREILNMYVL